MWPAVSLAPTSDDAGQDGRRAGEPDVRDRDELALPAGGRRRQQQRHAIDDERLHDAVHQPLAEAQQVEVAVQVPREPYERTAVVVAVAVVHPVETRSGWRS